MVIYAHRGLSARYPENTLLAFRHALATGADGIELDVHLTADKVPVVIHDRDVKRTTNGSGVVDQVALAHLQSFDAGEGQRAPTLAAVLDLVADHVHLDVEIKGKDIAHEVLTVLDQYPSARWAISSFDWATLRQIRRLTAAAELWPLADRSDNDLFAIAAELGAPTVSLFSGAYTPATAAAFSDAGLRVVAWTVNDVREAERVRGLGAYALCTDVPDRIITSGQTARRGQPPVLARE